MTLPILRVVLLFGATSLSLAAQRLAPTHSPAQLPPGLPSTHDVVADFDGDGALDVLECGDPTQPWRLSRSDGAGWFSDLAPVASPIGRFDVRLVDDFDGDGDLDLGYGGSGAWAIAWNDGTGNFGSTTTLVAQSPWETLASGDIDGDGDADLVGYGNPSAGQLQTIASWTNDGAGTFSQRFMAPGQFLPTGPEFDLIDGDGDGDLDFFATQFWVNDGSGRFTDGTAARFPGAGVPVGPLKFADFNGDGRTDLATPYSIYLDDGSGMLTVSVTLNAALAADVEVFDVEGDGDLDVVIPYSAASGALVYQNDGSGNFAPVGGVFPGEGLVDPHVLDLDGDGDLDLFSPPLRMLLGDGQGGYFDAQAQPLAEEVPSLARALGDVNSDGRVDWVCYTDTEVRVYLQNQFSEFSSGQRFPLPGGPYLGGPDLLLEDLDGDGHLDLVYGLYVYRGDGSGGFALASSPVQTFARTTVVGDVDGDGDLDLAYPNGLHVNAGGLVFQPRPADLGFGGADIDAGDVDGDGDLDIVTALNGSGAVKLSLNDGAGGFVDGASQLPVPHVDGVTRAVHLVDVDGDGDLDLLVGNMGFVFVQIAIYYERVWLYENDGNGVFTDVTLSQFGFRPRSRDAVAADFDLDGDVDILTVGETSRLYEGTSSGFVNRTNQWLEPDASVLADPQTVDIDGDGDVDVAMGDGLGNPRFSHSRRRQLRGPVVARTGNDLVLEAYVEAPVVETVIPVLALLKSHTPVATPWGDLHLDLTASLTLMPQRATWGRRATWRFPIPPIPSIVGLDLYTQAAFVPSGGGAWQLSNAIRHPIVE